MRWLTNNWQFVVDEEHNEQFLAGEFALKVVTVAIYYIFV